MDAGVARTPDPVNFSIFLESYKMTPLVGHQVASYAYTLPEPLSLPPNRNWRVGLVSMIFPKHIVNILELSFRLKLSGDRWRGYNLKAAHCSSPAGFNAAFQRSIPHEAGKVFVFTYRQDLDILLLEVKGNGNGCSFGAQMAELLGFPKGGIYEKPAVYGGVSPPQINRGSDLLYVHCDFIINPTFQDFISSGEGRSGGGVCAFHPQKPVYLPVNHGVLREMRVDLKNERGDLVRFEEPTPPLIIQLLKRATLDENPTPASLTAIFDPRDLPENDRVINEWFRSSPLALGGDAAAVDAFGDL